MMQRPIAQPYKGPMITNAIRLPCGVPVYFKRLAPRFMLCFPNVTTVYCEHYYIDNY